MGKVDNDHRRRAEQEFAAVVGREPVDDEIAQTTAADERRQRRAGDDLQ